MYMHFPPSAPGRACFNTSFKVTVCTLFLLDTTISPHQAHPAFQKLRVVVCHLAFHTVPHTMLMGNLFHGRDPLAASYPHHSCLRAASLSPASSKQNPPPSPPFLCSLARTQGSPHLCMKNWWLREWEKSGQKEHIAVIAVFPQHPFHTSLAPPSLIREIQLFGLHINVSLFFEGLSDGVLWAMCIWVWWTPFYKILK